MAGAWRGRGRDRAARCPVNRQAKVFVHGIVDVGAGRRFIGIDLAAGLAIVAAAKVGVGEQRHGGTAASVSSAAVWMRTWEGVTCSVAATGCIADAAMARANMFRGSSRVRQMTNNRLIYRTEVGTLPV